MPLSSQNSTETCRLLVHFGYHKALTQFFKQIFTLLTEQLGWYYRHHNSNLQAFYTDVLERDEKRLVGVDHWLIDFDRLPNFLGSHVIRDPRDLLISGYRYHLWCNEKWACRPMDARLHKRLELESLGLNKNAQSKSYQQLLNSVDEHTGLMIELNWRRPHFQQMAEWNYQDPRILELRYEEVFGNESGEVMKLLLHYGLLEHEALPIAKFADQISFLQLSKKKQTGENEHASVGRIDRWKSELPSQLRQEFKNRHGELLVQLGYESNQNW